MASQEQGHRQEVDNAIYHTLRSMQLTQTLLGAEVQDGRSRYGSWPELLLPKCVRRDLNRNVGTPIIGIN